MINALLNIFLRFS